MAMQNPTTPIELADVSLRRRERALLVGGTRTGKSTFSEGLIADWFWRYPKSVILILDSKPRYRAQWEASGLPAKRRYRKWRHGVTVPGSVVVSDPADIKMALRTGARIVIAQGNGARDVPMLVACARFFLDDLAQTRLVVVDETMDFFSSNGSPRGGDDALVRVARAGAERDCAGLFCSQRTQQIPGQLLEELTKLYLFRLDYAKDVKRLYEMGAPASIQMPTEGGGVFVYWTKLDYRRVYGPYKLDLDSI